MFASRLRTPPAAALVLALTLVVGCSDDATRPATGGGRVCTSFDRYIHILSSVDASSDTRRAVRRGDVVYVTDGAAGVLAIDVSDATDPVIVSTTATPGEPADVAVDSTHLYVATRSDGVYIYDISNPVAPSPVGHHGTSGQSLGISVIDTLLYVANDGLGLLVLSVRDPSGPRQIGGENTPGEARDVVVSGDIAYLSDGALGLRVVSIAVPSDPILMTSLAIPGQPRGIDLKDNALYVASSTAGLQVVDVGNPLLPQIVDVVPMPGGVRDVAVHNDRAYAADRFSGIHVLDLADPLKPAVATSVAVLGEALGVNCGGELLFVSGGLRLSIVDSSNPNPPPVVSVEPTPDVTGEALGAFQVGEAVYVCDGPAGVQIADVSVPTSPMFVDDIVLDGAQHLVVNDDIAYIAGENATLQVDVTDPFAPNVLTSSMPGALRVAANDSLVFLAQGRGGVSVYRVVAQGAVQFLQNINPASLVYAHDVAIAGSYVYVAWGRSGLQVIDPNRLGGPLFPIVASYTASTATLAVAIHDHYALLITLAGLEIIDIQSPTTPAPVSSLLLPGPLSVATTSGQTSYIAARQAGIHVVDLLDPARPTLTGSLHSGGTVMGVTANSSFIYAADSDNGLVTADAQCE